MKTIYLKENKYKLLFTEAIDSEFDYDELKQLNSYSAKVKYCKQHLGMPIGNGSSRICFQIDDQWILKLAKNAKGIAQNEVEGQEDYYKSSMCIFPIIDYEKSDTENYTFLISEYVLLAKQKDFKVCLGISFNKFCEFIYQSASQYMRKSYIIREYMPWDTFSQMEEESDTLHDFNEYLTNYRIPCGDICRLANLGMVLRDKTPQIVVLDSGFDDNVAKKHYGYVMESMQQGFKLSDLDSITNLTQRIEYCKKYLGEPIGKGTSRIVFEIGDDTVLKLALNEKQIFQNKGEFMNSSKLQNKFPNLFPRVYQHANDYSWIICERVLPFKHEDCITILGIPYSSNYIQYAKDWEKAKNGDGTNLGYEKYMTPNQIEPEIDFDDNEDVDISLVGFIDWAESSRYEEDMGKANDVFFELMKQNKWYQDVYNYIMQVNGVTDIFDNNLGLAIRDNKPYIVILDNGFDDIS